MQWKLTEILTNGIMRNWETTPIVGAIGFLRYFTTLLKSKATPNTKVFTRDTTIIPYRKTCKNEI